MSATKRQSLRAGIDIGGTFTDLIVYDETSGDFVVGKTLTTPDDPSRAIETGLGETLQRAARPIEDVGQIIHGTTLVTNALIERKGAATALMASEGHRDSLEIGREHRYDLYDLQLEMPIPLVPRYLRFPVPGRTLANGSTLPEHDLDEGYIEQLAKELTEAGIEAIAIARGPLVSGGLSNQFGTGFNVSVQSGIGAPSPSLCSILRRLPNGEQIIIKVDLNKALRDPRERVLIQPKDFIFLQETVDEAVARYWTNIFQINFLGTLFQRRDGIATATINAP